jgi:hypothetical protein
MATEKFKWQTVVSKYAYPETWRSVWQVINSLVPFIVMWYLMVRSLEVGYWLTLILAVPKGHGAFVHHLSRLLSWFILSIHAGQ